MQTVPQGSACRHLLNEVASSQGPPPHCPPQSCFRASPKQEAQRV